MLSLLVLNAGALIAKWSKSACQLHIVGGEMEIREALRFGSIGRGVNALRRFSGMAPIRALFVPLGPLAHYDGGRAVRRTKKLGVVAGTIRVVIWWSRVFWW